MTGFGRLGVILAFAALLAGAAQTQTSTSPLDLNRATAAQLQTLPGIGPAKAKAILARRNRRRFRRVRELLRIKGIGPKTFKRLKPLVFVKKKIKNRP